MTDHELEFARKWLDEKLPGGYTITSIEDTTESFCQRLSSTYVPILPIPWKLKSPSTTTNQPRNN